MSRWVGRSHACCAVLRCSLCRSSVLALHHWNCVPAGPAKPAAAASLSHTHPEQIRTCSCTLLQHRSNSLSDHTCACMRVHNTSLSNLNGGRSTNRGLLASTDRGHRQNIVAASTNFFLPFFRFPFLSVAVQFFGVLLAVTDPEHPEQSHHTRDRESFLAVGPQILH